MAKPFVKWAGGKTQLLKEIENNLPSNFSKFDTYVEPFVGGGSVLFWISSKFSSLKNLVISDSNENLINTYFAVRDNSAELIECLKNIYFKFKFFSKDKQETFFKKIRKEYNDRVAPLDPMTKASYFIFLNKTCFNGLYRVNSNNQFNVPFGKYDNPIIWDPDTLKEDSKILKNVTIKCCNYSDTISYVGPNSFYYLDPPYRPLSDTSSFNQYTSKPFDDTQQIQLKKFCDELNNLGSSFLLSNSDPMSANNDPFFENLYSNYIIKKIDANRNINSKSTKRGSVKELLIKNY